MPYDPALHCPQRYVQVTWKQPNGRKRTAWGIELRQTGKLCFFTLVTPEGEKIHELLVAQADEGLVVKEARISKRYGEMELV